MTKIKAIGFDWGGVLTEDPSYRAMQHCAEAFGVSYDIFLLEYEKYINDFQVDKISENKIWKNLAETFNVKIAENISLWKDGIGKGLKEKEEMFILLEKLKQHGYTLAFLSNTEMPAIAHFNESKHNYPKIFDVAIFSCVEKCAKPSKEIFEILVNRLKLTPSEIIFVDDKHENVVSANACGINAIQFKSYNQLLNDLKNYNVVLT